MWVLTSAGGGWHGPAGRERMMAEVASLVRKLRADLGVEAYWYSPELHPGGHGWHCNLFVGRRLAHAEVAAAWGHGYVWAKDWTQDSRVKGTTFLERLRRGATYGAKYAAKDWSAEMLQRGAHRYELAQGFEPAVLVAETRTLAEGLALVVDRCGRLAHVWRSEEDPSWSGPPCWVAFAVGPSG
jgi:hypothetical protein